tara:strand:- start:6 stop:953 length:948 start_codon:yes stop_codon:yes gene_type:complete
MRIFRSFKITKDYMNSTLAIGNFDGVHEGHQAVINEAKRISKKNKTKIGVLTFEPHPKCYFKKEYDFFRLTPFREKFEILKLHGIDFVINIKFNEVFLKKSAMDFIKLHLVEDLKVSSVVTGFDFVFGNKKVGDVKYMNEYVHKTNAFGFFTVSEVKNKDNHEVSSSIIRKFLRNGKIENANCLLTRNWTVTGKVIKGEQKARKIGFRTVNIKMNKYCDIKRGVYLVSIKINEDYNNKKLLGIANFGVKPTFNQTEPLLEVHIFKFDKDIYNRLVKITFHKFIRDEKKFESIEKLKDQIIKDINVVKNDRFFQNN